MSRRPDFRQLETELLQAMRDSDHAVLDRLLSEDLVLTTAGWLREPVGKRAWLDALAVHQLETVEVLDVVVRDYGCVVVVLVHSRQSGQFRNALYTHELRYTDVWVESSEGAWQLDVRHATALPDL